MDDELRLLSRVPPVPLNVFGRPMKNKRKFERALNIIRASFSPVPLMLFKNLVFLRLPAEWTSTAADLEGQLAGRTLQPCGPFARPSRRLLPVTRAGGRLPTAS